MIYKNVFIIIFSFFLEINIFSGCCDCRKSHIDNNLNIDNNESNINNNLKDEESKDEELKDDKPKKKEEDTEKKNVNYRKSKIKYINGKCGYQILLLTLCRLFKDKDDILDDFENGRNLKDDSPENIDLLKKIAEIVKKYKNSTDDNQIDVDDFIKVYLISLIYNCKKLTLEEYKSRSSKVTNLCLLTNESSEYLCKNNLFIPSYRKHNQITESDIEKFNKCKENLKNFDYNIIKNNNIKDIYIANFICFFLEYLSMIYKNLDLEIDEDFKMFEFKGYDYELKKNIDLIKNKELFLITLTVQDSVAKHICEIYKENDKYWFCCCNKEIEVSYDDIINQRFQKIIDDWKNIKEFETYDYKFIKIYDFICIS